MTRCSFIKSRVINRMKKMINFHFSHFFFLATFSRRVCFLQYIYENKYSYFTTIKNKTSKIDKNMDLYYMKPRNIKNEEGYKEKIDFLKKHLIRKFNKLYYILNRIFQFYEGNIIFLLPQIYKF
ncbi:hypothetical protein EDEG_00115 [Edhazardia aedis USNM 41457]|uniref:Uncharacterized protein n=1 Tax=Edhazardia aedis (strain USNM 41457) TaxID=1003232 RepID=J9DQQ4_EDHAE|nr:hypothetical protein EDEG_00115 [Edhazardia aedis USNM 41457]|eukprot:EJW04895.1 hypothetical protein EDEG_00115 [Edhazardia aedis USNM 41457]